MSLGGRTVQWFGGPGKVCRLAVRPRKSAEQTGRAGCPPETNRNHSGLAESCGSGRRVAGTEVRRGTSSSRPFGTEPDEARCESAESGGLAVQLKAIAVPLAAVVW